MKFVLVASFSSVYGLLTVVDARSTGVIVDEPAVIVDEDDCACDVVNKAYVVGDCKCELAGGGGKVKAVSISVPVFVGGDPEPGVCTDEPCTNPKDCTYRNIQVSVTIASCARKCSGHGTDATHIGYGRTYSPPGGWSGTPAGGSVAIGGSESVTGLSPNNNGANFCGAGPYKDTLVFKKANGQTLAEVVFEFGCGKCKAAQSQ